MNNIFFSFLVIFAASSCLWVDEISEGVSHMTGNSQNGPTVHFSHEISRMHSTLSNFLTKHLQSLYNSEYGTNDVGPACKGQNLW